MGRESEDQIFGARTSVGPFDSAITRLATEWTFPATRKCNMLYSEDSSDPLTPLQREIVRLIPRLEDEFRSNALARSNASVADYAPLTFGKGLLVLVLVLAAIYRF